ncbi:RHS repeat-associated core domain-containing protein, partial [Pseudomonas sp. NPDC089734]|uniref:RHS repeat-associated core domain-containing protein n=1 Tax=Pseudomonas sp. NPDC089734 TaxID=3364469 RepID=UPI003827F410
YEATRHYRYVLSAVDGQQAEQEVTDVKGVKTRTLLDGLNRVVEAFGQGADENNPADYFRIYSAVYDHRGLMVQDTETDWLPTGNDDEPAPRLRELALTSTYQYDDWGEQCRVTSPDGVSQVVENDPIRQTVRRWIQSSDTPPQIGSMSETRSNLFGKPDWNRALDASGNILSQNDYVYDGLGRCIQELDALSHSTSLHYDAWSRLTGTTLPDLTVVERDYAPHSNDALSTHLRVKADQAPDAILLGEQHFDGLDRATQVRVGPRITRFLYKGTQSQVDECITPGNHSIHFQYEPGLTAQPVRTLAEDEQADFTYDFKTAALMTSQNSRSRSEFEYNRNGQLNVERRVEDGVTRETHHVSSFGGRALSRQEPGGLTSVYEYDALGRIESIRQGLLQAELHWSSLGQLQSIFTTDTGSGNRLETRLHYNDQGQETERTLELTGHDTRTLTQAWRKDGRLISRHLQTPTRSLLDESFDYDERGRLILHACSGETLPKDRYGHGIAEQRFDFDALDNITVLNSTFSDGSTDQALFGFAPDDPTQLVSITHTHPDYPASLLLDYDADGNLLHDENAQQLIYDTQSRLLGVIATDGSETVQYRYDSHHHLVGVRHGNQDEALRFYQDERLSTCIQGNETTSYLYGGNQPLGQQTQGDESRTLLFMTDAKQSLLGESQQTDLRTAVYSAYGERSSDDGLSSLLGFNGEVRDEVSGWYLLGRGYRAYNPTLMRFHSPDSLSPFGAGGLNPYVYCLGDPIGFIDPTGHISKGLFQALNIAGMVLGMIGTVATGGVVAPALSLQFALFAVAQAAGVGAVVTGAVGTFTPDRQAKKVLGITSAILGVVSLLFGLASVATGTSKWFGKSIGNIDTLSRKTSINSLSTVSDVDTAPSILASPSIPRSSISQASRSSVAASSGEVDEAALLKIIFERRKNFDPTLELDSNWSMSYPRPPSPPPPTTVRTASVQTQTSTTVETASVQTQAPPTVRAASVPSQAPTTAATASLPEASPVPREFVEWINRTGGQVSTLNKTHKAGNLRETMAHIRRDSLP